MRERYSHIRMAAKREAVEALKTAKPVQDAAAGEADVKRDWEDAVIH